MSWDLCRKPSNGNAWKHTLWIPPVDHWWREIPSLAEKVQPEARHFQQKACYWIRWSRLSPYGQFSSSGFWLFILLCCSSCNDTGPNSLPNRSSNFHLHWRYQAIQESKSMRTTWWTAEEEHLRLGTYPNTMADKIQSRLPSDTHGEGNDPNVTHWFSNRLHFTLKLCGI